MATAHRPQVTASHPLAFPDLPSTIVNYPLATGDCLSMTGDRRLATATRRPQLIVQKEYNIITLSKQKNFKMKGIKLKHLNFFLF